MALTCNIVVVSGGVWRFARAGEAPFRRLAPFLATSIPAAWVGGRLVVPEATFVLVLGAALFVAGAQLLAQRAGPMTIERQESALRTAPPMGRALAVGGAIGLLAGIVGIGGGVFLAPVLYYLKFGPPRTVAAACSLFILLNSVSGAVGQLVKLSDLALLSLARPFWPLVPAVLVGGQIGSWLSAEGLRPVWIKRLTAVLILYAAARLLLRWVGMIA